MASDNLMAMEQPPWSFRSAFADTWISDLFNRENDALTRALQRSFASDSSNDDVFSAEMMEKFFAKPPIQTASTTPTVSGGSENESPVSKRRRLQPSGKVTKRKSRAAKRETTTYITTDPEHFRLMVQQVTGARFDGVGGRFPVPPVVRPEPYKAAVHRLQPCGELATFDTSALLLEGSSRLVTQLTPTPSSLVVTNDGATAALDVDSFCSFPTLESWKV